MIKHNTKTHRQKIEYNKQRKNIMICLKNLNV